MPLEKLEPRSVPHTGLVWVATTIATTIYCVIVSQLRNLTTYENIWEVLRQNAILGKSKLGKDPDG
jgi:hypothetical protein